LTGLLFGLYLSTHLYNFEVSASEIKQEETEVIPENILLEENDEEEIKLTAVVTAYSCAGLTSIEQYRMNCRSMLDDMGEPTLSPKTAIGQTPLPYKTVACDKKFLRNVYELIINENKYQVICNDTGGAINGEGRFDLYVDSYSDAIKFGNQNIEYKLI